MKKCSKNECAIFQDQRCCAGCNENCFNSCNEDVKTCPNSCELVKE